ncbi:SigE family RNA polymerase sigma factor [Acrocarpospora phusangensis]|uniref:SigE family RNA polymerase sigma factor n=1 Tax=Acrocarpospora phusangensis TaxID=1070424 RepID=UPI001EF1A4AF|nr:SigE family RNA polymerase sigma factor [Acrocarpospora phusangensis]
MIADEEFNLFFERHHRELGRLAYLLTGDADEADDLTADAFVAAWRRWDRVRNAAHPLAYMRGIVARLASSRVRRLLRERRKLGAMGAGAAEAADGPDVPAVLDVRAALRRLPPRKRACVVLRHAFDLSERETAEVLGISVGTVKSQTSKAVAELEQALGGSTRITSLLLQEPRLDGPHG